MEENVMREPEEDDLDIFDSIEEILEDDTALTIISSRFDNWDSEKIRSIVKPLLNIFKKRGVEMFSGGDDIRAEALQGYMDTANSYAGIVHEFWPLLKTIYQYIKENKAAAGSLDDEDWNDMLFEEQTAPQMQQMPPQMQQQQQQAIDPNFIGPPPQQAYGAQNMQPQPVRQQDNGLTLESMLEKHMEKFGSKGMDDVVRDFEKLSKRDLGIEVADSVLPTQEAGQTGPVARGKEPELNNMTMKDMVARHQAKFGNEGMEKVGEEMKSAGLDTGDLDFTDESIQGETDDKDFVMDDEEEHLSTAFDENATKRARLDDMPRPGFDDDRDDYLD
jgi:hypothetical protein